MYSNDKIVFALRTNNIPFIIVPLYDKLYKLMKINKAIKHYRNQGAVGALLDEYERSLNDLIRIIKPISKSDLIKIRDKKTKDRDCISIQTILSHIIQSGYTYVIETKKWMGEDIEYKGIVLYNDVDEYIHAIKTMFNYNENLFKDYPKLVMTENENHKKIHVRWGQDYDVEQLFEHAIVHILRHRRQIERYLLR